MTGFRNIVKRFASKVKRIPPGRESADEFHHDVRALIESEQFLEGYGVPTSEVACMFRIKDDRHGEPVRVGSYNRGKLLMKDHEISFALRMISKYFPSGSRVIDIASGSGLLPLFLAALGYNAVHQDIHPCTFEYTGLENVSCDVLDLPQSLALESVDAVTLICALEHFGLGRYGDRLDGAADFKAIDGIAEILKPGGGVVVTVPFGPPALVFNTHRVYDYERLQKAFTKFEIVEEEYLLWPDWRSVTREQAEDIELVSVGKRPGKNYSLAMWFLRKLAV